MIPYTTKIGYKRISECDNTSRIIKSLRGSAWIASLRKLANQNAKEIQGSNDSTRMMNMPIRIRGTSISPLEYFRSYVA